MKTENKINYWILASRPKTLPAAVVPVMVGSALAINQGKFYPLYSVIALICSLLIQVGTNFTNDLYDHLKGADTEKRKGPSRVLSAGLISVNEMRNAIILVFSLTFVLGLYLVYVTDWKILVIGIFSIIAGLAYTAGPYPLAYHGLGDLFVFLFFGIVGTMGTYYLHHQDFTIISLIVSLPVGALITNILIVNNYRDIEEDKEAGKNTLAVILGRQFSRYEYIFFLLLSFFVPFILYFEFHFNATIFLPYLTLPFAIILVKMIYNYQGQQLNKTLEVSAKYSALYGLLFSAGLII
ncbi:MAG: 1,4-dihydroxy-2-naphthoate polyprenyltransferase [Ignavibacterium album]|uniref:1,4-dihydroxy-2-naphthoate polyprenyltransferase n=1 Tax=Ignavibacterium album TaxID=591197 RepID=UPI0026EA8D2B|nr:1,4-dihydroxy-2-naphthoate polyprenyltransferase [Ignavibacterium album]MCX8106828.1 1,4-dihydroxy-2-naphthoate polyprenyltransferase [Ignavibacterium album]